MVEVYHNLKNKKNTKKFYFSKRKKKLHRRPQKVQRVENVMEPSGMKADGFTASITKKASC